MCHNSGMNCLPFTSPEAALSNAGGKGMNLSRLTRAGFPVPAGFIIQTEAYRSFVDANGLDQAIELALAGALPEDPASIEQASANIREAFASGKVPPEAELAIRLAHAELKDSPLAVRSSSTAEDLPDLSFAGQQDTYLNVIGAEALLKAVVQCWGSLWTGRAIGYRMRNGIPHEDVSLAVVVQEMVESRVSGVLFTANPLTGLLNETVIDAAFGLGEALVSGQVEPDHFVVDSASGAVNEIRLGAKEIAARSRAGGGVESVREGAGARQTLSQDEIRQLAALGQQVQKEYGPPQDIEWAFADDRLYLLQARPITSLFPVPEVSFDPLKVWFSFGAVQGLVGPITPLGRDAIQHLVVGAGAMFGVKPKREELDVFVPAGERLWIKISDVIRHPVGYRIVSELMNFIEPSVYQILARLAGDPRLGAGKGKLKLSTLRQLAHFALPVLGRMVRTMRQPEKARARFDAAIEDYLAMASIPAASDRFERLAAVTAFMRDRIANAFPFLLPKFIPLFGPSMALLNLLNEIAGDDRSLALEVTRGLPGNVTTEMDLALWAAASAIRADAAANDLFSAADALQLARRYLDASLPPAAQAAIASFMERYGVRGVGEIDFGQPRWREDPAPVMFTLKSYLDIPPESAPDVQFAKGRKAAEEAIEKLAALARRQRGGWLKEKLARGAAERIRILMGARESPKFFAIRTMGIGRAELLAVGQEFVAAGTIERADDLVFLKLDELEALARRENRSWKAVIAGRRAAYEREARRKQAPRVLVSDGRAFYEGVGAAGDSGEVIRGSPVSPGLVEGIVHVVLDPRGAQLAPGEILVCPGTDPAWTPLFLAAGGLITEVGGLMTHGSVVAREYGIPAVVGAHRATLSLKTGQRVRLNGSTGVIEVIR